MYHSETIVKNDGARYRYLYNSDSASQIFVPGSETEGFFFALQCRSAGLSAMNNCAYRYSPKFEQRGTFEPRGLPAKPLAAGQ